MRLIDPAVFKRVRLLHSADRRASRRALGAVYEDSSYTHYAVPVFVAECWNPGCLTGPSWEGSTSGAKSQPRTAESWLSRHMDNAHGEESYFGASSA